MCCGLDWVNSIVSTAKQPVISKQSTEAQPRLGQRIVERIGNTPLLRLERASSEFPNIQIFAKAEWFNPGGSVKDRAAYSMIREGERRGDSALERSSWTRPAATPALLTP